MRVHDNPALVKACEGASAVQPVFVLDPWFIKPERVGANRLRFLLESLTDLDASLRARGSSLLVLHGDPARVIPAALEAWRCDRLCYEFDTEPYAQKRDASVNEAARALGVEVHAPVSHTLWDLDRLLARCPRGEPPTAYASFLKIAHGLGPVPTPAPDVPSITPLPRGDALSDGKEDLVHALRDVITGSGIPSPERLGYESIKAGEGFPARGGETEGLARLREMLARTTYIAEFKKPQTNPTELWTPVRAGEEGKAGGKGNPFDAAKKSSKSQSATAEAFMAPSTTALSPYLKFGCVSPRTFWHELRAVLDVELEGKHSKPPESLEGQLLWREFYYLAGYGTPNYDRMAGNRICRQIPWTWDEERLAAWEEARTGFPWIDACMMQLKREGWIHHLARHAVACFLTRRLVRALGSGRGGFRPRAGGRGLGSEQRQLDVAQLQLLLLPVLSGVRAGEFRQKVRQGGRVHPQVLTPAQGHAGQVHIRAVDRADRGAEEGPVRGRRGLSGTHRGPRGGVEGVHRKDRGGLRRAQGRNRGEHRRRREEAESRRWSLRAFKTFDVIELNIRLLSFDVGEYGRGVNQVRVEHRLRRPLPVGRVISLFLVA